jgi:transcriptional regulator with XRE-family HTH domain
MALFFDRLWFESKLNALGLTRADLAICSGLSADELSLIFKDQRELSRHHVQAWAILLNETTGEIAKRCGVSTPASPVPTDAQRIASLEGRVARLEIQLQDLLRPPSAKS